MICPGLTVGALIMRDMAQNGFVTTGYRLDYPGLKHSLVFLMLGDLHGEIYGPDNEDLVRSAKEMNPDVILCPGDMITAEHPEDIGPAASLLRRLSGIAPVYFAPGNHETKMRRFPREYRAMIRTFRDAEIHILRNKSETAEIGGEKIRFTGLELPIEKYRKLRKPRLDKEELLKLIGPRGEGVFQVLIAHNPCFAAQYAGLWGADLTVCGHYHGGMIRVLNDRCLASPYGFPFPKYGYGHFRIGSCHVITTSGLGDHMIPFRFNNPTEIVKISAGHPGRIREGGLKAD